ncbi:helix-hairpin-helix domain-containing protein [Skermanella sp. TT6]|uniref:Helix-hairpin-helix domain-containing protein n=1 Tax=Skermanella cutis TaxID=2775420 RepID=A0ABX7B474_9PROT|nr:helix-hairpin-helix domain-containing protein [Skermanella sp. TT6]QQP89141.1 helix-hairpin-helix domain-containing protein [Skermanella sp. TT6]
MELDKKTVAGAVAAVAVGAIGAAVAYTALAGDEGNAEAGQPKQPRPEAKPAGQDEAAPTGAININQAPPSHLTTLKHIGKARAKRILANRPFRSVDELVSRGLVPEEVLARHRDRLTV